MKFIQKIFLVLLVIQPIIGAAQNGSDAGAYLEFIGNQYGEISKDIMSYTSAIAHGKSARKVEKNRTELMNTIKESERNVRKMKPFNGDSKLRDSVASYFRICQILLSHDYGKIVNMEEIAEQSYDDMEAYLLAKQKANEKLHEASDRAGAEYDAFAADNKIKLIASNSKLGEKLTLASKVSDYNDVLYLIFFKSYKDEAYFLDALSKNDVNAMEQTKNSLAKSCAEGISKVGPIQPFQGDGSLKNACQQALNFYKKEAAVHFPIMIEFLLKNDNYEKMRKAFDASREKTDEQVAAFNKAVNEFNVWVKKYNAANDECNKGRALILERWSDTSDQFLDSHTPKYR